MQSVVVLKFDSKVGLLVCKIDHSNQHGLVSAHFPSLLQTLIGMALSEKLKAILLEISCLFIQREARWPEGPAR